YFYLHFPLIIVFGIWLYYYRRGQYTFVRDSFLASGAIALVIYFLYPVAPPRELPELAARFDPGAPGYILGFFDTMEAYLGYAYDTQSTRAFVNPYAAMPSLHFGWDLLLGIAVIRAFRRTPLLWIAAPIGVALPVLQVFSITLTANHYFIDAVAGGIVAMAGLGVAYSLKKWGYPWLGDRFRRLPWLRARSLLLQD
ncbi:MAG: phosphatase PAP2 family protein, partial [Dehalococcoidia bacterium]